MPSLSSTFAVPRNSRTWYGHDPLSMVTATSGCDAIALSLGAAFGLRGDAITTSEPVHWNQIGTTRGVPSVHVYANRASCAEAKSSWATLSLSTSSTFMG